MDETGSSLSVRFHLEIVAFQPTFYDIGNECSVGDAGKDITVTVTVVFKHFIIFLKNIFDCQGNDTSKPKTNQTACQIEIVNLDTVLSMAETVQAVDIDHSTEGAAYIGKVHGMNINYRLSSPSIHKFLDYGARNHRPHS